jgi:hypothetical protein
MQKNCLQNDFVRGLILPQHNASHIRRNDMNEYQNQLQKWVAGLSDETLCDYMNELDRFSDAELDALFMEDVRRMQAA